MYRNFTRWLALLSMAWALVGCGGGGGGDDDPVVTPAPTAQAGAAQTVLQGAQVALDGSASTSADGTALAYAWTLVSRPAGSAATLVSADTATPTFTADVEGVYGASLVVSSGSVPSAAASVEITSVGASGFSIATSVAEPLSGDVTLSLVGPSSELANEVDWYVDLVPIGEGQTTVWATDSASNAIHLVIAQVRSAGKPLFEVRKSVAVANSGIDISIFLSGWTGDVRANVWARSTNDIQSVAVSIDGVPQGSLTEPNLCSRYCPDGPDVYGFLLDPTLTTSGPHTFSATARDDAGNTQQTSTVIPISNPPTVVVDTPMAGAFIYGGLTVSGRVGTDKDAVLTTTATLGEFEFFSTTEREFSTTYDLTGLVPGTYSLGVRVADGTGSSSGWYGPIVIASSPALAYTPVSTVGYAVLPVAAEGNLVLLQHAYDHTMSLLDTATRTEVVLQNATSNMRSSGWQLSGGRVYITGDDSDCPSSSCIYQWLSDGTRRNISTGLSGSATPNQAEPIARDGYVVWESDTGEARSHTLYKVSDGSYRSILPPGGGAPDMAGHDFTVIGGVVNLFYSTLPTDGEQHGVNRWRSDTGTSVLISAAGEDAIQPMVDASRVAWRSGSYRGSLSTQPLAGGVTTQVASDVRGDISLKDGVLLWWEGDADTFASVLKASTLTGVQTISQASQRMYGNGGGVVTFEQQGQLYSWNAVSRAITLRADVAPSPWAAQAGDTLYFFLDPPDSYASSGSRALYKVKMN